MDPSRSFLRPYLGLLASICPLIRHQAHARQRWLMASRHIAEREARGIARERAENRGLGAGKGFRWHRWCRQAGAPTPGVVWVRGKAGLGGSRSMVPSLAYWPCRFSLAPKDHLPYALNQRTARASQPPALVAALAPLAKARDDRGGGRRQSGAAGKEPGPATR